MIQRIKSLLNPSIWISRIYSAFKKRSIGSCGSNFNVVYPTAILEGRNITIGNDFYATADLCLFANDGGRLVIGNNSHFNKNVFIGASGGKIMIGNDVLIGPNVVLRASNHGIRKDVLMREQPHSYGEIIIEDDVWIGSNSVILSGVTLTRGTVVAAGAIVTKSTSPYTIVGGVPAHEIGKRT